MRAGVSQQEPQTPDTGISRQPPGFPGTALGSKPTRRLGARRHHPLQIYDFTRKPIRPPRLLTHLLTQFICPEHPRVLTREKELYFKNVQREKS